MKRLVRTFLLAIVAVAMTAGVFGETRDAAAANRYEQWTVDSSGCYTYWDGFAYASAICPRTDGGYDFYAADAGQWAPTFSAGYMAGGSIWMIYGGTTYVIQPQQQSVEEQMFPDGLTVGGSRVGGTGDPMVDGLLFDSNQVGGKIWLDPTCAYRDNQYCYVY